jgi:CheY-like chemotaxis protein
MTTAVAKTKCRTLIVEDDPTSRDRLSQLLRMTGHEVTTAGDGSAAIAEVTAQRPDCVILDLMLPDVSGVEVLRVIREKKLPIKVAVYSAAADLHRFPGLAELKPDAIFAKGTDLARLRAWLEQQT